MVEGGVVAADAGIELESDAHRLEALAQARAELCEIEAVLRARERRAEAAIGRLEHVDDAGEAVPGEQRAVEPALRRAAGMHALDHGAVLRRHQARRLGARDPERVHGLIDRELQASRGAGGGGIDPERRAGVPALADMLLAHAPSDPRPDLVAGHGGGEKFLAAESGMTLRHRDQRRQRDCADMQHALAVDVVELEALHLRAVGERRVGRGEAQLGAPHRRGTGCVHRFKRPLQNAAPFEVGAIDGAAERVEDQQLDPLAHLGGDCLVGERRDELGDLAGVHVVPAGMLGHLWFPLVDARLREPGSNRDWIRSPGLAAERASRPCRRLCSGASTAGTCPAARPDRAAAPGCP
jgi:hypothetical protein